MSVYGQALLVLSPLLALVFWLAAGLLVVQARRCRQGRRRMGSVLWCVHAGIYWTVNGVLRWFFGYDTPTLGMSAWAAVVFVHAAFSMLWMASLMVRYESSPDSSRYE